MTSIYPSNTIEHLVELTQADLNDQVRIHSILSQKWGNFAVLLDNIANGRASVDPAILLQTFIAEELCVNPTDKVYWEIYNLLLIPLTGSIATLHTKSKA